MLLFLGCYEIENASQGGGGFIFIWRQEVNISVVSSTKDHVDVWVLKGEWSVVEIYR